MPILRSFSIVFVTPLLGHEVTGGASVNASRFFKCFKGTQHLELTIHSRDSRFPPVLVLRDLRVATRFQACNKWLRREIREIQATVNVLILLFVFLSARETRSRAVHGGRFFVEVTANASHGTVDHNLRFPPSFVFCNVDEHALRCSRLVHAIAVKALSEVTVLANGRLRRHIIKINVGVHLCSHRPFCL